MNCERLSRLISTYSLREVNLKPLLMIMPDAYSGMLSEGVSGQPRTQLVAGIGTQVVESVIQGSGSLRANALKCLRQDQLDQLAQPGQLDRRESFPAYGVQRKGYNRHCRNEIEVY